MVSAPSDVSETFQAFQGLLAEVQLAPAFDIWLLPPPGILAVTAVAIFGAGVLASASGIGGSGLYVPILLIFGNLSPHQAIPLAKALVFVGSLMAFYANLGKRDGAGCRLIDLPILKNIASPALVGTLMGVLTHVHTPHGILVILVSLALCYTSLKTFLHALTTFANENAQARRPLLSLRSLRESSERSKCARLREGLCTHFRLNSALPSWRDARPRHEALTEDAAVGSSETTIGTPRVDHFAYISICRDVTMLVLVFVVVIACGSVQTFFPDGSPLQAGFLGFGIFVALLVSVALRSSCFRSEGEATHRVSFMVVSFVAGFCASCIGISGGLIIAPFLIAMDIQPERALCTSATCVLFIAASTTFQFLFMGRILVYYAVVLGIVAACASLCGARIIHWVKRATGRSSISIFVLAAASSISCFCIMSKSAELFQGDHANIHFHLEFGVLVFQVVAATGWKITTCVDDIMWLAPFLAPTRGKVMPTLFKTAAYVAVVQTVVFLASCAMWSSDWLAEMLAERGTFINARAVLILLSGSLLLCFAGFLFREWYSEIFEEATDDGSEEGDEEIARNKNLSAGRFMLVSFTSQLDELASFTTALLGGLFSPLALSLGCVIACLAVASVCLGALRFRVLANCILAVPIWIIIGGVAVYNILYGLRALV